MDKNDKRCFFNFALTLEAYDDLMKHLENNTKLSEEEVQILNLYESLLFELAIQEINTLRYALIQQHSKYISLMIQAEKAKKFIDELMTEIAKLKAQSEKEAEKIEKQPEIHNDDKPKKKPSFISSIKKKIDELFN